MIFNGTVVIFDEAALALDWFVSWGLGVPKNYWQFVVSECDFKIRNKLVNIHIVWFLLFRIGFRIYNFFVGYRIHSLSIS